MKSLPKALIVFMRYPEPGKVKSRLAVSIGPDSAARIYEKLLRRTLGMVTDFKSLNPEVDIFVSFSAEGKKSVVESSYAGPWKFMDQAGTHLGDKMERAMEGVMARGYGHVSLIGTDIADLSSEDLKEAFAALEKGYAVLGPAKDGGFYLIGLSERCSCAFRGQSWGASDVFKRTERLLEDCGLQVLGLKERRDIDRLEDLGFLNNQPFFRNSLSVIVPTLSPLDRLQPLLSSLEAGLWPGDEIILVYAGEKGDSSPEEGIGRKTRWLASPKGRGLQLNHGTRAAGGDIFFFLHDDSIPPPQFAYLVRKISTASNASLGCFQLGFYPSTPILNMIAGWANFRTRHFKFPYGDQGLFCRRKSFERAGGFKNLYLMEDVDFVRHSRRMGELLILPEKLYTSPRRYRQKGILRASMQNHLMMLLYCLGVDERRLYSLYYGFK